MSKKAQPSWVDKLLADTDVRREGLKPLILRRKIRYNLFRLQTAAAGGPEADSVPRGFKKHYADQKWFDGWANFGITWDVGDPVEPKQRGGDDPLVAVPRYLSVTEEWEEVIESHVKSDTISARKRARARKMEEVNGSEDSL